MKSTRFKNRVGGFILAFSVLFGIGLLSSTTAQAQWRRDDDYYRQRRNDDYDRDRRYRNRDYRNDQYNDRYGYNNAFRVAQQQGYQQGVYTGSSDAQRRQSFNPYRSRYYKNPPNNFGGRGNQFDQAYRSGFLQGYRQGYQQYDGYYGNGRYGRNSGTRWPW